MMIIAPSTRLRYRLMTQQDSELLAELDSDPAVMRYITNGQPTSREQIEQFYLPRLAKFTNPPQGWGLWHCSLIDDDTFLGWVLIRPMHFFDGDMDERDLEIGWRFKQMAWGKGYATEAAGHIAAHLAKQNKMDYLSAIALKDNLGSINIMKKLSMTFLKEGKHSGPDGPEDVVYYRKTV
ncbi:GNAT family N-acetyltransferase [Pseudoalteromonas sp. DL2-H2.2]|uniref:GNAT family N-acetyltransferase n=1 Tax=Pseudoalteromonas sp. DL2-H2.2 TaxID=2908889 RepID=UPI001F32104B|nr:GNAT family N-acetyltransferase [Pseudoalteromonas sp. DL2-H2.2]MCF2907445.1 GNAT family N-acetyltransferase [Pseudoalteromonas sp. DL2-H2.2]